MLAVVMFLYVAQLFFLVMAGFTMLSAFSKMFDSSKRQEAAKLSLQALLYSGISVVLGAASLGILG